MKNMSWITINGLPAMEILAGLGFTVKNDSIIDTTGKEYRIKDIKAIVGTKDGKLMIITDVSELEDDE